MSIHSCKNCFEKQLRIDNLEQENIRLKSQLSAAKKKQNDGPFGSSTPSSKKNFKTNAKPDDVKKMGGAKVGHKGHGRKISNVDREEILNLDPNCPDCGEPLTKKKSVCRSVVDVPDLKPKTIGYICGKGFCRRCNKTFQAKPKVLPRSLFGNGLISHAISLHYEQGVPLGRIEDIYGINHGSLFAVFHRVARRLKPTYALLISQLRVEPVIHADETGWRTDGHSGYAWLFCSPRTSVFRFANTRASAIPRQILGTEKLPGCLVRDRYAGYHFALCRQQYCFAHLLRHVEDLEKEFEGNEEVTDFVNKMATLLSDAMKLRGRDISDGEYDKTAKQIESDILVLANQFAQHLGIKSIQNIFLENEDRLFHWVKDRNIPPDNNRAEREIRPTVIARKVSFGSQSENGAETRSIIMSVIHTAKKRTKSRTTIDWIKTLLDWWAENPEPKSDDILHKLE